MGYHVDHKWTWQESTGTSYHHPTPTLRSPNFFVLLPVTHLAEKRTIADDQSTNQSTSSPNTYQPTYPPSYPPTYLPTYLATYPTFVFANQPTPAAPAPAATCSADQPWSSSAFTSAPCCSKILRSKGEAMVTVMVAVSHRCSSDGEPKMR